MQNPPPVQTAKSSTGLDENVAALLAYILHWVSGLVFFLIEKDSRLVRFHAMQSILLSVVVAVVVIALMIITFILGLISTQLPGILGTLISLLMTLVWIVLWIGVLIAWIICMIKAFQSQYFKLPIIGNFAEQFSAKK